MKDFEVKDVKKIICDTNTKDIIALYLVKKKKGKKEMVGIGSNKTNPESLLTTFITLESARKAIMQKMKEKGMIDDKEQPMFR